MVNSHRLEMKALVIHRKARLIYFIVACLFYAYPSFAHDLKIREIRLVQVSDREWQLTTNRAGSDQLINPIQLPPSCQCERALVDEQLVINLRCNDQEPPALIKLHWPFDIVVLSSSNTVQSIVSQSGILQIPLVSSKTGYQQFTTFIHLGTQHIIFGLDHLLFLICLLLIVTSPKAQALALSAFTVGHCFTLIAATLNWVSLPPKSVEVAIALTLLASAIDIMRYEKWHLTGLIYRRLWWVVLSFGAIHGFGFASSLQAYLPAQASVVPALLAFNLGVEIGQVLIVLAVYGLVQKLLWPLFKARCRTTLNIASFTRTVIAFIVASIAAWWLGVRLASIFVF